jgi:hypothetical protein
MKTQLLESQLTKSEQLLELSQVSKPKTKKVNLLNQQTSYYKIYAQTVL